MLAVGQLPDDTVVTAFNIALNFHNLGLSRVEGAALGLFQNADIYINNRSLSQAILQKSQQTMVISCSLTLE